MLLESIAFKIDLTSLRFPFSTKCKPSQKNNEQFNAPLFSFQTLFWFIKWKLLNKHLDSRRSFISLIVNFYTISFDAKIDETITKKIILNAGINAKINVLLFNLKTVTFMNFNLIIIIKSLWRNWSHNRSVMKRVNNNQ